MSIYEGLTSGEKRWLLETNQFVGSALELLRQRDQYVATVEKALAAEGARELEVQLFREQQLASTFTFIEKLTEEAGRLMAELYGQRITPKDIAGNFSILEATRNYMDLIADIEFHQKTYGIIY